MPVRGEFIVNLKGKEFVMLGGLLQLAHEQGIRSIETNLVIELCNPAERSFVVQAIGTFPAKESGEPVVWSAYGDASPANSQMRGAELRHAETRAIARMLRWATNCPTTAFEELGPDTEPENGQKGGSPARTARPAPSQAPRATLAPKDAQTASDAVCSEPGCGVVLNEGEIKTCERYFHGQPLVCRVHAKERAAAIKAAEEVTHGVG